MATHLEPRGKFDLKFDMWATISPADWQKYGGADWYPGAIGPGKYALFGGYDGARYVADQSPTHTCVLCRQQKPTTDLCIVEASTHLIYYCNVYCIPYEWGKTFDKIAEGEYFFCTHGGIYQRIPEVIRSHRGNENKSNAINIHSGQYELTEDCVCADPLNYVPADRIYWAEKIEIVIHTPDTRSYEFGIGGIAQADDPYYTTPQVEPTGKYRWQIMAKASCGHIIPRSQLMNASLGSACPDCYDRLSG